MLWMVIALLLASVVVPSALVVTRDWGNNPDRQPQLAAPSLDELNESIELAQRYVNALYKPLPGGMAVQSEASGVPLKAHFLNDNKWVLLGEELEVCDGQRCDPTTYIKPVTSGELDETYTVGFHKQERRSALEVTARIDWAYAAAGIRLTLLPERVAEPVELWLDERKLATYLPEAFAPSEVDLPVYDARPLRMLRYTVRHATQEAYLYWTTYGDNPERASALASFLRQNGIEPGYDLRAPIFGASDGLPDNLPFNEDAYPDCKRRLPSNEFAYAYRSKVCLFRDSYLDVAGRDPLLQSLQALHILVKYGDPNHKLPGSGWWLQGSTPAEIARHLRGQWNETGFGVRKCTPFSCEGNTETEVSGIRTFEFGTLMTQLAFRYGDAGAVSFADAAAHMTVKAQVKADGVIVMKEGKYFRPGHIGAYLAAWDNADARFVVPSTPVLVAYAAYQLTGEEPIPPEYIGVQPSNSETTLDGLGFLLLYRCAKYRVGCVI
jgi:hypothetical protein